MLKLNKEITIGEFTYTHMLLVKGEWDLRIPYVEIHPALVRTDGGLFLIGRATLTDTGVRAQFSELLTTIRLAPSTGSSSEMDDFIVALRNQFVVFLENLDQIIVALQSDAQRNQLTTMKVALAEFSLSCTFEPLADAKIHLELVDKRTPPNEKNREILSNSQ